MGREGGFRTEAAVVRVRDAEAFALGAVAEIEGVVGEGIDGEPVFAVDGLTDGGEVREEILAFGGADLGDGLTFHVDDVEFLLVDPDEAVEEAHVAEDLAGADLEDPAIDSIHGFVAADLGFVIPEAVLGEDEGLDITDIAEVFGREEEGLEGIDGGADGLFGALTGGREDDVAYLFIHAAGGAVAVELFQGDGLAVHVLVALGLGFGFAMGDEAGQIGWRVLGGLSGRCGLGRGGAEGEEGLEKPEC